MEFSINGVATIMEFSVIYVSMVGGGVLDVNSWTQPVHGQFVDTGCSWSVSGQTIFQDLLGAKYMVWLTEFTIQ